MKHVFRVGVGVSIETKEDLLGGKIVTYEGMIWSPPKELKRDMSEPFFYVKRERGEPGTRNVTNYVIPHRKVVRVNGRPFTPLNCHVLEDGRSDNVIDFAAEKRRRAQPANSPDVGIVEDSIAC